MTISVFQKKILIVFAFFFTALSVRAAEKMLSFDRPAREGELYDVDIALSAAREYRIDVPGAREPVHRTESVQLALFGKMTVLAVGKQGAVEKFRFEITLASGYLNGLPFESALLNGKTVLADLSGEKSVFRDASNGRELAGREKAFFGTLFRPPPEKGLKNTFGAPRIPRKGEKWDIDISQLRKSLEKRGFTLRPGSVVGRAEMVGKRNFRGHDVYEIRTVAESRTTPELDFRLNATILIPEDNNLPVLRVERTGREIVTGKMRSVDPVASGTKIQSVSMEKFEATLLPAKDSGKNFSWSDFILR